MYDTCHTQHEWICASDDTYTQLPASSEHGGGGRPRRQAGGRAAAAAAASPFQQRHASAYRTSAESSASCAAAGGCCCCCCCCSCCCCCCSGACCSCMVASWMGLWSSKGFWKAGLLKQRCLGPPASAGGWVRLETGALQPCRLAGCVFLCSNCDMRCRKCSPGVSWRPCDAALLAPGGTSSVSTAQRHISRVDWRVTIVAIESVEQGFVGPATLPREPSGLQPSLLEAPGAARA